MSARARKRLRRRRRELLALARRAGREEKKAPKVSLIHVPVAVLQNNLMQYLEAEEIVRLSSTSKHFYKACGAQIVWKQRMLNTYGRTEAWCGPELNAEPIVGGDPDGHGDDGDDATDDGDAGAETPVRDVDQQWMARLTRRRRREMAAAEASATASTAVSDNVSDWKLAYVLRATGTLGEMCCYHTDQHLFQDVLGFPLEVSVNPRLRKVDYIAPTMDILSRTAYVSENVTRTNYGIRFQNWLPLYLTAGHWKRARPEFERCIVSLCRHHHTRRFRRGMVLEVIPKAMITVSVLLADKGAAACARALRGFASLHRLFLQAVIDDPALQRDVDAKIANFMSSERIRHKKSTSSLGDFLPLLFVSEKYCWDDVWRAYLRESFDRAVLWLCKAHPELAVLPSRDEMADPEKLAALRDRRLELSLDAIRVRFRVSMMSVYFLKFFCRGSVRDRARRYDAVFGRPGASVAAGAPTEDQFKSSVEAILEARTWPEIFARLAIACPPKKKVAQLLEESVRNSLRRGYHKKGMDFSRIQRRGVSKILRRGETFSIKRGIESIAMGCGWTCDYDLATGVLVYDRITKKFIEPIDWRNLQSEYFPISHSGDVTNGYNGTPAGADQEVIWVDLDGVERWAKRQNPQVDPVLVFCLAIWRGSNDLRTVRNGYVRLQNSKKNEEMCFFPLDMPGFKRAQAMVLCKVYRDHTAKSDAKVAPASAGDAKVAPSPSTAGDAKTVTPKDCGVGVWKMMPIGETVEGEIIEPREMVDTVRNRYLHDTYRCKDYIYTS